MPFVKNFNIDLNGQGQLKNTKSVNICGTESIFNDTYVIEY